MPTSKTPRVTKYAHDGYEWNTVFVFIECSFLLSQLRVEPSSLRYDAPSPSSPANTGVCLGLLLQGEPVWEKTGIQKQGIGSQKSDDGGWTWSPQSGWSPEDGRLEVYTFRLREAESDAACPGFDLPTAPSVRYWPYPAHHPQLSRPIIINQSLINSLSYKLLQLTVKRFFEGGKWLGSAL
jgi:hypothetical protein